MKPTSLSDGPFEMAYLHIYNGPFIYKKIWRQIIVDVNFQDGAVEARYKGGINLIIYYGFNRRSMACPVIY